ncbi:MAG: indole-3-glycerol phosphate synthase TrpC [Candidatus Omnitrophota bacterium]|jgi:indole-3-glycerol phosphate synthase
MILHDIVQAKRADLEELKRRFPLHRLKEAAEARERTDVRSFQQAIAVPRGLRLICELKKASPSHGIICEDFQPLRLAGLFEYAGAAALSVLTETRYFKGRPSYLRIVRQVTTIPIMRKDFIFESYQLYETALLEADAFLLIASLLTDAELADLIALGRRLKMDALVEVHSEDDLKKALGAGATIVGINNRNLKTMQVEVQTAKRLLGRIPKEVCVVIESGLSKHDELMEYKSLGVNAFLIGTAVMKSPDPVRTIRDLGGLQR